MGFRSKDDGPSLDRSRELSRSADEGIFVLDRRGRFVAVDDVVLRATGFDREALIGKPAAILINDGDATRISQAIRRRLEGDVDRLDTFATTVFTPAGETIPIELRLAVLTIDDEFVGTVGVARVERAHPLREQHFQSLVEGIEDHAIFLLDGSGRVRSWNAGAAAILGYDGEEALGRPLETFYTEQARRNDLPRRALHTARVRGSHSDVGWRVRADGTPFWATATLSGVEGPDGELQGYITIVRDVSERREYERRLDARRREVETELDEILGRISDAFIALDSQLRFTHVNEHAESLLGHTEAELLGRPIGEAYPEAEIALDGYFNSVLEDGQPRTDAFQFPPLDAWLELSVYPSETGLSVYFRDVTERKNRELELERYEFIMETVWDGIVMLDESGRFVELNQAFLELTGFERHDLIGRPISMVLDDQADAVHFRTGMEENRPDVVEFDLDTAAGETVAVEARFGPYEQDDGTVGGVGVVRDVSDRKARESILERQRRRLTAINHLNEVIRDISQTAIEAASRAVIEQRVCADLAELYSAVWISSIERGGDENIRANAGNAANAEMVRPMVDITAGDRPRFLTVGQARTADDVDQLAVATIPLAHDGRRYGVLTVCSERPFATPDREVLTHLAEIVAASIHTIEQRRALVAQRVVELELEIDADDHRLATAMGGEAASIRIDRVLAERDGAVTLFIETDGFEWTQFVPAIEELLDVDSISLLREDGDRHLVTLTASDIPLLGTTIRHGGRMLAIEISRSGFVIVVEVPWHVDVRELVEQFREQVDGLMLRAKRARDRERPTLETLDDVVAEDLTDRQRAVLETAYLAGYFEWPRRATGEEVAAMLDVSGATFTEHLRIAEGKLLKHVFTDRAR